MRQLMALVPRALHMALLASPRRTWLSLKSSLWFVPTVCVLFATGLAGGMVEWDSRLELQLAEQWPTFFGLSAEGSRSILATIAQSVITIAGVAFSITIVALSLAANQYTPRVLRNFMRDRGNQFVLGGLVGIFTYCVIVLRTIRGGEKPFVPALSVMLALLFAFVAIGLFIYFIHHVATTIQASTILSSIANETREVIRTLLPREAAPGATDCDLTREEEELLAKGEWQAIPCQNTGYLQSVDAEALISYAREHHAVIRMQLAVGDFSTQGKPLVWIKTEGPLAERSATDVNRFFAIKAFRTIEQDMRFGIRQIVDIAVKALSPGINDPTTARTCLCYLASILCQLAGRHIPPRCVYREGRLCVVDRRPNFEGLVDLAFDEIRQNGGRQPIVLLGMLAAIEEVAAVRFPVPERGHSLMKHADLVLRMAEQTIRFSPDLDKIRTAAEHCRRAVEEHSRR